MAVASNSTSKFLKNMVNIPFIFILVALMVYIKLNGAAHYPVWEDMIYVGPNHVNIIDAYIIMVVIFLFWAARRTEGEMRRPFHEAAGVFGAFFIGTLAIMYMLVYLGVLGVADPIAHELFWPTVIFQFTCVATAEELMFRGVLLDVTHSVLVQAILFGVWHGYAYQILYYDVGLSAVDFVPVFFAIGFGIILGIVALNKKFGLPAVIAIHGTYNCVILGCFIIGSGV